MDLGQRASERDAACGLSFGGGDGDGTWGESTSSGPCTFGDPFGSPLDSRLDVEIIEAKTRGADRRSLWSIRRLRAVYKYE